ncbi:MAG TPA: hypothetical protein VG939_02265 [Caulobacteraceae bacterium]|nr:hypothetical protein [Caulobacteraceae bacterium]
MAASKPQPSAVQVPAARRIQSLRDAIEKALQDDVSREDLILRLTLSDAAALKRDRSVGVDEITFGPGGMRFLGVDIAHDAVAESVLERR